MKDLKTIKKGLKSERPMPWEFLPDIELYMDQVLTYVKRQLINERPEANLTAAMVNNYIRDKIIPRTVGKKYTKDHLALLTAICVLKPVLSVGDISFLFRLFSKDKIKEIYESYRLVLDEQLLSASNAISEADDEQEIADAIIRFAISSYANKVAAEQLIDMLKERKK